MVTDISDIMINSSFKIMHQSNLKTMNFDIKDAIF
jgi:hypothetical protein